MSHQFRSHPVPAGSVGTPPPSYLGGGGHQGGNESATGAGGSSSFATSAAVQQLVPSSNAPIDEQVHVLRGALVVTMEEVERLRNSMNIENGKLQREMREVIRTVSSGSGGQANTSASAGGHWGTTSSSNNNKSGDFSAAAAIGGGGGGADEETQSRLEYLEQVVRGLQQHQSLHAPVAMENAISQCSIFLRKADQEVQRVVTQMQEKMNAWQRIMDNFVSNSNAIAADHAAAAASAQRSMSGGASAAATQMMHGLDVVADVKRMVQARIMELSAYIDQELAAHRGSIITLEDKMGAVIETVTRIETENNAFRAAVSRPHVRSAMAMASSSAAGKPGVAGIQSASTGGTILGSSSNVTGGAMTSPALEDLSSPPRRPQQPQPQSDSRGMAPTPPAGINTSNNNNNIVGGNTPGGAPFVAAGALRGGVRNNNNSTSNNASSLASGAGSSTAEAIQTLLREFTQVESQVIKEEILKQLDGEATLTRRRLEERNRGEQVSMLRQDVVRTVTSLETMQEDHVRLERQQQDLHRAFQRLEQHFTLLQHKTEGDIRTELNRLEALQKSFFVRQEQLIAAERQQMITNVTEQVNRMQQKHVEEVRMAERRRVDDLQAAQKQIRDDFVSFAEKQRKDLDDAIQHVKDDFSALSNQANDNVARSLANATDATRRSFMNTTDEMRKSYNKISDDMRRLQSSVEDNTKRSQEQQNFLQQRLQQVIDEQVVRVDRMGEDLALRLNTAVEEEVKRMTQSSETALQRAFGTVDDRQTRDAKALREEIAAVRQALHAMSAPSSTLQSLDSRVDALRNDVQEMFETVAAVKRNEPRIMADSRREVNSALETARSEITRNVGLQLQQFDSTLAELHRESMQRSQELTALQMRLDQAVQSGTFQNNSSSNVNTSNPYLGYGSSAVSRGLTSSPPPAVVSAVTGGGQHGRTGSQPPVLPGGSGNVMPPAPRTPTGSAAPKRDALQGAFDP